MGKIFQGREEISYSMCYKVPHPILTCNDHNECGKRKMTSTTLIFFFLFSYISIKQIA